MVFVGFSSPGSSPVSSPGTICDRDIADIQDRPFTPRHDTWWRAVIQGCEARKVC